MREYHITKDDQDLRLDRYVKKLLPQAGLSLIYKSIRKKNITVNGAKAREDETLREGDVVRIFFSDETLEKLGREKKPVHGKKPNIVLETEDFLIMNKPSGLLSHSAKGDYGPNLVDDMIYYLRSTGAYVPRRDVTFRPALLHRLDRNTSGLIVGAKTGRGLRDGTRWIREFALSKRYRTIVAGKFTDQTIVSRMGKDEGKNRVFQAEGGKEAKGIYRLLDYRGGKSLVEVDLITGRTHQIRYQLSSVGHPILGDSKYGGKKMEGGQLLQCHQLIFPKTENYPELSGRKVEIPMDAKMKKIWEGDHE
ncbi:MAG: RluA family pseudouridine synthase [Tissierellia bacterium]|nr:RluA family pseudouridine synthase [Tissierellia bacterium]